MKTDISIPKPIFNSAEQLAKKHGMSLSEFCAAALSAYVRVHEENAETKALNQVYNTEPSSLDPELVKMQVTSFDGET
ncbi:MAG: hypothetical protein ACE5I1_30425 [bacterium]